MEIVFFKRNEISGEFKMTIEDFKEKFFKWLKLKDKDWCNYYGPANAVYEFIHADLDSVTADPNNYDYLGKLIKDEFWDVVETKIN